MFNIGVYINRSGKQYQMYGSSALWYKKNNEFYGAIVQENRVFVILDTFDPIDDNYPVVPAKIFYVDEDKGRCIGYIGLTDEAKTPSMSKYSFGDVEVDGVVYQSFKMRYKEPYYRYFGEHTGYKYIGDTEVGARVLVKPGIVDTRYDKKYMAVEFVETGENKNHWIIVDGAVNMGMDGAIEEGRASSRYDMIGIYGDWMDEIDEELGLK